MSVKWTGKVWDLDLPPGEAWVLMAMVDHADHQGNNIYPGVGLIAWKTGYSDKQVMRLVDKLLAKNLIIEDGKMPDGQTKYKADFSQAKRKAEYQGRKKLAQQRADKMSTLEGGQNVYPEASEMSTHGQTFCPDGVDILSDSHNKERARVLTVMEPSIKPSHTHSARASEREERSSGGSASKFTLKTCLAFAEHLKAAGGGITNPGGYATIIFRTGEADSLIEQFLRTPEAPDVTLCPDCGGKGFVYLDPDDMTLGVKQCRHERLKQQARQECGDESSSNQVLK